MERIDQEKSINSVKREPESSVKRECSSIRSSPVKIADEAKSEARSINRSSGVKREPESPKPLPKIEEKVEAKTEPKPKR